MGNFVNPSRAKLLNVSVYAAIFVVFAWVLLLNPIPVNGTDFWMHAGHVELFSQNMSAPQSTYDEAEAIRVRNFAPWQAFLAGSKNLFDLSTMQMMSIGSIITLATLLTGLWLASAIVSSSMLSPITLAICVFFVIGEGYSWSEEVHIRSLFITASYPSSIAVAISFINWFLIDRYLREKTFLLGVGFVVCTALTLLIHPMVFLHAMVFLAIWVVMSARNWRLLFETAAMVLIAVGLSLLWPYFNPVEVSYAAISGAERRLDNVFISERLAILETPRRQFFGIENMINHLGLALAGYFLVFFVNEKLRWRLAAFMVFSTLMWHFGKTLPVPASGYRWAMPTILILQVIYANRLAIAAEIVTSKKPAFTGIYIGSLAMLLVTSAVALDNVRKVYWIVGPVAQQASGSAYSATQELIELKNKLTAAGLDQQIVAADRKTTYALLGLGLKPTVFSRKYHPVNTRLDKLFSDDISSDKRQSILRSLGAGILIIDQTNKPQLFETQIGTDLSQVASNGRYVAYILI